METRRLEMPADVLAVHREIEAWREKREKRGPVPSSIWFAATALAKRYSVYRVAQALHLNYGALKRRLLEDTNSDEKSGRRNETKACCEFVELTGFGSSGENSTRTTGENSRGYQLEIEVSDGHGSQMTVRVLEGVGVDVSQIVREFCGRSR